MKVVIVDGMGGGIGKSLAEEIIKKEMEIELVCVGTNSIATSNMMKAGVDIAATGENAIIYNINSADIVLGPVGLLMENSMYGEISPKITNAMSSSRAKKIIIPLTNEKLYIAGLEEYSLAEKISQAVSLCEEVVNSQQRPY